MSFSIETLQDFALTLINDESARAAYAADPVGVLKEAGLSHLTPADVQEVLPLVADSLPPVGLPTDGSAAPMDGGLADLPVLGDLPVELPAGVPGLGDLPGLDALPVDGLPGLGDLPVDGLPGLGDLPVDGLPGLGDLPVDGLPGLGDLPIDGLPALPELGDLPVELPADVPGLGDLPTGLPTGLPGLGDLPSPAIPSLGDLDTPLGDLTAGVDTATTGLGLDLDGDALDTSVSGFLANPADSDAPTVSTFAGTALGDLAAGAKLDPEEFGGSIAGSSEVADAGLGLVGHDNGDVAAWGGVDTVAGDLAGGLHASLDGVALAAESPLGSFSADSDGDFSIEPADPSDLLDLDHLGTTGDAVAGTVAHVAATGSDSVTGGIESGSDSLEGLLTGPAAPVAGVLDTTTDTVTDGIEQGGDQVSEHLSNLPAVDDLPLPQLPELPQLPDLPTIDSAALPAVGDVTGTVSDTVGGVTGHLPVDTGAVTDLVSDNPVTDAVHDSPVGGLVSGVTDHLPQDTPLLGDLDLGL